MNAYARKVTGIERQSDAGSITGSSENRAGFYHQDNRAGSIVQKKQVEALANGGLVQHKQNNTGLPDQLKSGIENISGHSMDDVKVHYNSGQPAQLNAHAYAQGTDIHIAPGQEKHLPHEAWHVVQQKQGRVQPTMQMNGRVNINDDKGLEKEADRMGADGLRKNNSIQRKAIENFFLPKKAPSSAVVIQRAINAVDTSRLPDNRKIQKLIFEYNNNYKQETLDELVALAERYKPATLGEKEALQNLIRELDIEAGNRHVVTDRVNLPRNMNDADKDTMDKNCALTSIGALIGCKASDVHKDLGEDGSEQDSDIFIKNKRHEREGDDRLSAQINGMVRYVKGAFERMGFSVNIRGYNARKYEMMSPEHGLAAMKQYPTGTKFLVYMSKTEDTHGESHSGKTAHIMGMPLGSHWVFADRYGSQVFFYDYQVGRVQKEILRQGERALSLPGGGASSPVQSVRNSPVQSGENSPVQSGESSPVQSGQNSPRKGGIKSVFDMSDFAEALEKHQSKRDISHNSPRGESREPVVVQDIPEATFEGRIPKYERSNVSFLDYNSMFFIAVIPHIVNREILQKKMGELE
jgi:hypothetical protein